jgi:ABC-type multidrug transport system ATPase subunit
MSAEPILKVKNLKKYFGRIKAVDGISFEVAKGEVFGFLGPNGAGKTTAIRCILDFSRTSLFGTFCCGDHALRYSDS